MHIARVWESAATQLASNQDQTAERFRFKDVVPGIDRYQRLVGAIDWLSAADLIIKLPIANKALLQLKAHTKESLFKLFYLDVGLLICRCGLSATHIIRDNYGGFKSYIAENFVAQALLAADPHELRQDFAWQEQKAELEFLLSTEQGIIPIEVKSSKYTRAKSLEKYIGKYEPEFAVILSANNISHDPESRVYQFPIYLAVLKPWEKIDSKNRREWD